MKAYARIKTTQGGLALPAVVKRQHVKRTIPTFEIIVVFLSLAFAVETSFAQNDQFSSSIKPTPEPRIFNGLITSDYPTTGALLYRGSVNNPWQSICSGTLIGPYTFLTAGHCVCNTTGNDCQADNFNAPDTNNYRVLLQNAGIITINSIAIPSAFDFPDSDFAVINLSSPVQGIAASTLADSTPETNTNAVIVGFGNKTEGLNEATGIKRVGPVQTTVCNPSLAGYALICWETPASTTNANTCPGDSGGPLFVNAVMTGITSGGTGNCYGPDHSFDTPVALYKGAISSMSSAKLSSATLGEQISRLSTKAGVFDNQHSKETITLSISPEISRLLITANAEDHTDNAFVLNVRKNTRPENSCPFSHPGVFQACVIPKPDAGEWTIAYAKNQGLGGAYQLTVTEFSSVCSLDVDGDGIFDALTDGILAVRYLFGFSGAALTQSALSNNALRKTPAEISDFLSQAQCSQELDIDGDGALNALTDGLLMIRYLFNFGGNMLIQDVLGGRSVRTTETAIIQWLDSMKR